MKRTVLLSLPYDMTVLLDDTRITLISYHVILLCRSFFLLIVV